MLHVHVCMLHVLYMNLSHIHVHVRRWAVNHRAELHSNGSSLEFHLHQLKFVTLISTGRTNDALAYAKNLGHFAPKHSKGEGFEHATLACGDKDYFKV